MGVLALLSAIVVIHWIADFICQPPFIGREKSKRLSILWLHGLIYSSVLAALLVVTVGIFTITSISFPSLPVVSYALVNGGLHIVTDFFTSRKMRKFWDNKQVYPWIVTLGLDQLIHMLTFIVTLVIFI